MGTSSPVPCSELLQTMHQSPLNLALYLPGVSVISDAIKVNPQLFAIPAIAKSEQIFMTA